MGIFAIMSGMKQTNGIVSQVIHQKRRCLRRCGGVQWMSSLATQFEEAKSKLDSLKESPGNEIKLKIYGLFKQGTQGDVATSRPSMTNFVGRAKWDAWNANKNMSKENAQEAYIKLIRSICESQRITEESNLAPVSTYKNLLVERNGGLRKIIFNRPHRFNAISTEMYSEWEDALEEAKNDPFTVVTAMTGCGDYYSSGNDLSNFKEIIPGKEKEYIAERCKAMRKFIGDFIDFPKPLVAVVNGPAIGVAVTTLGLCDIVYASDRATFHTPFSSLGQGPEACSSNTFPRIMGLSNATDVLMFDKKIGCEEAMKLKLVAEIFPHDKLEKVWPKLKKYSELPAKSLFYTKETVWSQFRKDLHKANELEFDRLEERYNSEDCRNAVTNFLTKKENKK